ncbi:MAG: hypothetical protein HFG16_05215 [Erysipelotrichaceae bacterium]|jgi:hypothetical protein|nr:hypothetical protein [Erysipelotrichaceae bacterium]
MKRIRLKKAYITGLVLTVFLGLAGCSQETNEKVEGNLTDIMEEVYAGFSEDELPMFLENMEVTDDNAEMFLGTSDIEYKEALARESMTSSIAHSVVLVRMNDEASVEAAKEKIKENINPQKWICVGVEHVIVESRGDLIIVILDDDKGTELLKNFQNIGK